jgi:hypothetical protein
MDNLLHINNLALKKTGFHFIAQVGLELWILLPQCLDC